MTYFCNIVPSFAGPTSAGILGLIFYQCCHLVCTNATHLLPSKLFSTVPDFLMRSACSFREFGFISPPFCRFALSPSENPGPAPAARDPNWSQGPPKDHRQTPQSKGTCTVARAVVSATPGGDVGAKCEHVCAVVREGGGEGPHHSLRWVIPLARQEPSGFFQLPDFVPPPTPVS